MKSVNSIQQAGKTRQKLMRKHSNLQMLQLYKKEAMMFTNLNSTLYTVSTLATIKN